MRLTFRRAMVATAVFVLSAGISVAGASSKFAYAEQVTDTRSLAVDFEEGSLKRFASVDYQLAATALARYCGGGEVGEVLSSDIVAFAPDTKGRVSDTLTLVMNLSGLPCLPHYVEYTSVTLTNISTGHVYRLDSISRDAFSS